jgi:multidrug resistance efflux pump
VRANCELQPVVRRVIAAPFDGLLMRSRAKAGDLVKVGDLLAEMDGRELRSQLAQAVAERERALREADQALAAGDIAASKVAEHEAEALAHQIETLEYRKGHLEVRAPIEGIVLQGNWERSEGAPLRIGDPLFEIGPLDRFVAEVAVPATEVSLVEEGARVTVRLQSGTGGVLHGGITRVSPKSELLEEKNVFICEVPIENDQGDLRAGLKGKAKVEGPRRPLIWSWFRRAWLALRYYAW